MIKFFLLHFKKWITVHKNRGGVYSHFVIQLAQLNISYHGNHMLIHYFPTTPHLIVNPGNSPPICILFKTGTHLLKNAPMLIRAL